MAVRYNSLKVDTISIIWFTFISRRPKEAKLQLLKMLNDNIVAAIGISRDDLMVTPYETPARLFFGRGLAERAHISEPRTTRG